MKYSHFKQEVDVIAQTIHWITKIQILWMINSVKLGVCMEMVILMMISNQHRMILNWMINSSRNIIRSEVGLLVLSKDSHVISLVEVISSLRSSRVINSLINIWRKLKWLIWIDKKMMGLVIRISFIIMKIVINITLWIILEKLLIFKNVQINVCIN